MKLNCIYCSIITAAMILLSSCSNGPKFKVGDCIQYQDPMAEDWEPRSSSIERIIEVGKYSYHVEYWLYGAWHSYPEGSNSTSFRASMVKVECPKECKDNSCPYEKGSKQKEDVIWIQVE